MRHIFLVMYSIIITDIFIILTEFDEWLHNFAHWKWKCAVCENENNEFIILSVDGWINSETHQFHIQIRNLSDFLLIRLSFANAWTWHMIFFVMSLLAFFCRFEYFSFHVDRYSSNLWEKLIERLSGFCTDVRNWLFSS